ncbi:MAG: hypothetical protein AMXMBFR84_30380 [Candidatus Hydrogenedentota bacterium]
MSLVPTPMQFAFTAALFFTSGFYATAAPPTPASITFHNPTRDHRFYHAAVNLAPSNRAYTVETVEVNNYPEVFVALVDGAITQYNGTRVERTWNGRIPEGKPATFIVRCPWTNGQNIEVVLHGADQETKDSFECTVQGVAPNEGGFPFPGWKEHRILCLVETYGIPRENEPYLFFLSDEASRVKSWERELRIALFDPDSGRATEIPSQVLYEKRRFDTPMEEKAYSTCQAAFLANVPSNSGTCYLIAYGNPDAPATQYETDLKVRGASGTPQETNFGEVVIDNAFYEIQLHHASGQLNGFTSKQFGTGTNRKFGYMPDSGYPLHYNPDVWVRNRSWTHTKGWNPPPKMRVETGPVAVVVRRWGHLPRATEIEVEVVYHFFSNTPYVLVESTMDVMQDVVVNALRNEEVVFSPSTEVDHAGWMRTTGEIGYKPVVQEEGLTPGMIQILEADAPFVCLTRETDGLGMASIRLSQHAGSRGDQSPVVANTMTVLADYGWDFRYWSRSLIYPWGDFHEDRPTIANAGTYYGERSAYCLFPLGEGEAPEARLKYLADLHNRFTHPLRIDHQGAGPW